MLLFTHQDQRGSQNGSREEERNAFHEHQHPNRQRRTSSQSR